MNAMAPSLFFISYHLELFFSVIVGGHPQQHSTVFFVLFFPPQYRSKPAMAIVVTASKALDFFVLVRVIVQLLVVHFVLEQIWLRSVF